MASCKNIAIMGRKVGMTRWFTEDGANIPVTVIEAGPCVVTQVKTTETDGYAAVQFGFEDAKVSRVAIPQIAHDAKAKTAPKRFHREFRVDGDGEAEGFELGQAITVADLEGVKFVDIVGTSKGKGFQGVMKRHNFAGLEDSHGVERKHRSAGSIGGHATNLGTGPKPKKGKRMAGHMGAERVTVRSLDVIHADPEKNLLVVKGPVPGPNGGDLYIRPSIRLYKSKARVQAES
ncbi:MAG: ribosomal protein [Planctomycetota bacterium]|jgi:large subunit ribosomal protein L3